MASARINIPLAQSGVLPFTSTGTNVLAHHDASVHMPGGADIKLSRLLYSAERRKAILGKPFAGTAYRQLPIWIERVSAPLTGNMCHFYNSYYFELRHTLSAATALEHNLKFSFRRVPVTKKQLGRILNRLPAELRPFSSYNRAALIRFTLLLNKSGFAHSKIFHRTSWENVLTDLRYMAEFRPAYVQISGANACYCQNSYDSHDNVWPTMHRGVDALEIVSFFKRRNWRASLGAVLPLCSAQPLYSGRPVLLKRGTHAFMGTADGWIVAPKHTKVTISEEHTSLPSRSWRQAAPGGPYGAPTTSSIIIRGASIQTIGQDHPSLSTGHTAIIAAFPEKAMLTNTDSDVKTPLEYGAAVLLLPGNTFAIEHIPLRNSRGELVEGYRQNKRTLVATLTAPD